MGRQLTLAPVSAYEKQFGWQIVCFQKAPQRLGVKGNAGWQPYWLVLSRSHALAAENRVHEQGPVWGLTRPTAQIMLRPVQCAVLGKEILHNMFHSNTNQDRTFILSHLDPSADSKDV